MKEHILKYIELNPNRGYYDLCKIFGLSIEDLLTLLDINNYKIDKFNILRFYDKNNKIIYREYSNGEWKKYKYDVNNNLTYKEDSDGNKHKF